MLTHGLYTGETDAVCMYAHAYPSKAVLLEERGENYFLAIH